MADEAAAPVSRPELVALLGEAREQRNAAISELKVEVERLRGRITGVERSLEQAAQTDAGILDRVKAIEDGQKARNEQALERAEAENAAILERNKDRRRRNVAYLFSAVSLLIALGQPFIEQLLK